MKTLISFSLFLALSACGVEVKAPNEEGSDKDTSDESPTTDSSNNGPTNKELPLGLCSFETSKSRGCLKASIASTQFVIGPFIYQTGIREFARNFPSDLEDSDYVELKDGESINFVTPITIYNFHSSFYGVVEGLGVTYEAFHTGSGNLRLDNIVPGYYGVSLNRDFDLKIVNQNGKTVGYKCASIFTRREASIEVGKETLLGQQINEFELTIYDKSCSGLSIPK